MVGLFMDICFDGPVSSELVKGDLSADIFGKRERSGCFGRGGASASAQRGGLVWLVEDCAPFALIPMHFDSSLGITF